MEVRPTQTVKDMVSIVRYSPSGSKVRTAVNTLLGICPTFTRGDYYYVIREMRDIINFSDEPNRRDYASDVLVQVRRMGPPPVG
jgi:hypothetical protein